VVTVLLCVLFQNIVLDYKLLMTNGDDFFHKHFSADEFCKYALFNVLCTELVPYRTVRLIGSHALESRLSSCLVFDQLPVIKQQ